MKNLTVLQLLVCAMMAKLVTECTPFTNKVSAKDILLVLFLLSLYLMYTTWRAAALFAPFWKCFPTQENPSKKAITLSLSVTAKGLMLCILLLTVLIVVYTIYDYSINFLNILPTYWYLIHFLSLSL